MTIDWDDAFRDAYGDHDLYADELLARLEEEAERRYEREQEADDRLQERL